MSTKKMMRDLQRAGYIVNITKGDHLKITHPTKPGMVFTGATPSTKRSMQETTSQLRRTFGKPQE